MLLTSAALCLALNVYHEARGDGIESQILVIQTTLKRAKEGKKEICEVVTQKDQFSWTNNHLVKNGKVFAIDLAMVPTDVKAWNQAMLLAQQGITKRFKTKYQRKVAKMFVNVTHYHAETVHPSWANKMKLIGKAGTHLAYIDTSKKHKHA